MTVLRCVRSKGSTFVVPDSTPEISSEPIHPHHVIQRNLRGEKCEPAGRRVSRSYRAACKEYAELRIGGKNLTFSLLPAAISGEETREDIGVEVQ
jgi:hypothetical protein